MGDNFKVEGDIGGELSPGVTPRRYVPEGGVDKLRHRIHKESKFVDDHMNLPFTFSKPKKSGRSKIVECENCGTKSRVGINAVGIICRECKKYASVKEVTDE